MSARAPLADLGNALDRLAHGLSGCAELDGTSPGQFQSHLLPILAALGEVAEKARVALEPALLAETRRADAARAYHANAQAGEG